MQTHNLSEWAAVLSLSTGITASALVPWLLLVDSMSARDFDPRRLLGTRVADRALVEIVRVKGAAGEARERARLALVAALLVAVTHLDPSSAPKKGAHHA